MPALALHAWRTTASLGVLAFWGGMFIAERSYPSEYDWRYMTISSLVYGERNPDGYLWARAGIVLCGLAGLWWTTLLAGQGRRSSIAEPPVGRWALGLGFVCMTCCALLPERQVGLPKGHDVLALAAFVGLCIGMVYSSFKAVERSTRLARLAGSSRLHAGILAGVPLSPIVLAAVAQAHVAHALPGLPWVGLAWRARGIPVYLSFAFWEWVTCAVFSVYMLILSRTTLAARRASHP